ncbi:hypothetical protein BG011_007923 [Mortierella polycephala]|uniref:Nicotinamide N-methyltransferase n=1 Tax=Mortierella polycephala TaxID=41804 RepID=A0A9P6U8K4_9FUNG|nr:hypothetical protein BG011_007923 [Mortierella polycephala]
MAVKKKQFKLTSEQQEQIERKRQERIQKRDRSNGNGNGDTSTNSERDFLDGFEQSIGVFGDASVANGEVGQIFDYHQGLLQLHLANVDGGAVKLMSHYVWNAALVMAEYIEAGDVLDVQKKRVIEFGAGAALPGLLCAKRGAEFVTLTDYPDPAIVQNMERNWYENLAESAETKETRRIRNQESVHSAVYKELMDATDEQAHSKRRAVEQRVRCAVRGHAWGESVQEMLDCLPASDASLGPQSESNDTQHEQQVNQGYDIILMADTLWVSEGHPGLLKSCLSVLKKGDRSTSGGRVFVCCGLHSGYNTVHRFLALAQSSEYGFRSRLVGIRRVPVWGDTRTAEELRRESESLTEEDLDRFSVEDRNRTVLVYELTR